MPDVTPAPAPEPTVEARPDALKIPESMKRGATKRDRTDFICTFAEKILGGDRSKGVTAYIRQNPGQKKLFVTLDPEDMIGFPNKGPNRGPRYHWDPQPDGVDYGYLTDAAKAEKAAKKEKAGA